MLLGLQSEKEKNPQTCCAICLEGSWLTFGFPGVWGEVAGGVTILKVGFLPRLTIMIIYWASS